MRFQIYQGILDTLTKQVRKSAKSLKDASQLDCLKIGLERSPSLTNSTAMGIITNESLWFEERNVVFPDSEDLTTALLQSKISASAGFAFKPIHRSFVLAMPEGMSFEGTPLRSIIFSYLSVDELTEESLRLNEATDGLAPAINGAKIKSENVFLCSMVSKESQTFHIMGTDDDMQTMLAADDYLEAISRTSFGVLFSDDFTRDDASTIGMRQCFYGMRLAITASIYAVATNNECLSSNYPDLTLSPKRYLSRWDKSMSPTTLSSNNENMRSAPGAHVRAPHMRCLSHEKYYQGEFESLKRGSRFVFVKAASVGGLKPTTVEDVGSLD